MLIKLILLVALVMVIMLVVKWFMRTPPQQSKKVIGKVALWGVVGVFVILALTGRLSWLVALAAAAVPVIQRLFGLLRFLPLAQQVMAALGMAKAARGASGGQQSRVETAWLRMTLDHDSGTMDGEVLQGSYAGQRLGGMSLVQLVELLGQCQAQDAESVALLEAYLDRQHGSDWRQRGGPGAAGAADDGQAAAAAAGPLSRDEAYAILGLEEGASDEQINAAYKRLMQRLHPDRGGSSWLATRINEARDLLLG